MTTILERQKELRQANGNRHTKRYEKTPKGFLMRVYRNMQSRVTGVQQRKWHLYKGKPLLDRSDFRVWSIEHPDFKRLYANWISSYCDQQYTPSIDRIDPAKGYTIDNMQWITHSENSRRGGLWKPSLH